MVQGSEVFIHPTANVHATAKLGGGTSVWDWSKIREDANVGRNCNIGQSCYIDAGVVIGNECKIQNFVSVYSGVTLGDQVFVGPQVSFTNDMYPRACGNWSVFETHVEHGASIGSNATIVCGTRLGRYCMIGAGAVVTRDVPEFALIMGNPGRIQGYVTRSGRPVPWTAGEPVPSHTWLEME